MLIFNTTYTVPNSDARNFVIWVHQSMIPAAVTDNMLSKPRLLRLLSHKDPETEGFCLQFETASTSVLHKWFVAKGNHLQQELERLFEKRVLQFSTIMEIISED